MAIPSGVPVRQATVTTLNGFAAHTDAHFLYNPLRPEASATAELGLRLRLDAVNRTRGKRRKTRAEVCAGCVCGERSWTG